MAGSSCSRRFVIGVLFVRTKKNLLFQSNAQVTNLSERGGHAVNGMFCNGSDDIIYYDAQNNSTGYCTKNDITSAFSPF